MYNILLLQFTLNPSKYIKIIFLPQERHAQNNFNLDKRKLIIDTVYADEGPTLKRVRPRAQGRAYARLKPTCHITVIVKEAD